MTITAAGIVSLQTETKIAAAPADVWESMTAGINDWWPAEFYAGGSDGSRRFVLEAAPGGRFFEEWENGGGLLWGTVVTAEPARRLQITGTTFPAWGGPTQWLGSWGFDDENGGTLMSFDEHAIGRITDGYTAEKEKGWLFLWATLKAHIEGTAAPIWED